MTSIYTRFHASKRAGDHLGRLFFRLIRNRTSCEISSQYKIYNHEWNRQKQEIRIPLANTKRAKELEELAKKLEQEKQQIQSILLSLESKGTYTLKEVQMSYDLTLHSNSFFHFVQYLYDSMKYDQERTARAYESARRKLMQFNKGLDLPLEHINASFIKNFETHLKRELLKPNTISFYIRNLRAIYNKAVALKRIAKPLDNPFEGVYTGVQNTAKRALDTPEVYKIVSLNMEDVMNKYAGELATEEIQELQQAKDIFSFAFFSRGMSFVDIAYLKKSNIQNGVIRYNRKKTGQQLEITITPRLQELINRYSPEMKHSDYIFPIIKDAQKSSYKQYQNGLRKQNSLLKELAKYCEIDKPISTHVARHSWATIAKKEATPIWEISESLGHSSVKTTYIYLASFDRTKLDAVNDRVAMAVGF